MRRRISKFIAVLGALVLFWCCRVAWEYFDTNSPANLAMQVQLRMFGNAIYEYHAQTGGWPTKLDDLAQTSLPAKSYVWRQTATTIVFLWPQNLNSEAKDNARVLLAYWNGGLYNKLGRVWVCWGDLHTEHLKHSHLRTLLSNLPLGSSTATSTASALARSMYGSSCSKTRTITVSRCTCWIPIE